jgi:hypothetical protein
MLGQFVDSPVVNDGKIVGFSAGWTGQRKYPLDMAQFAVKVGSLKEAHNKTGDVFMDFIPAFEETSFLQKIGIPPLELEPLAENCTKVTRCQSY